MKIAVLLVLGLLVFLPAHAQEKSFGEEVRLEGTIGRLPDEEIKAPFRARWSEISHCYETAQIQHWFVSGKVMVKVRVSDEGRPKVTYIQSSDVGNYQAERCLLNIVSSLAFGHPQGGSEAEFVFPIEFRATNALETWTADHAKVQKRMKSLRHSVAACMNKGAPEEMQLTLYVVPGGKVASAGISADAPIEQAFGSCVVASGMKWRAEDPDRSIAKVTIPFSKTGLKKEK